MKVAVIVLLCIFALVPVSFALATSHGGGLPAQIVPCDGTDKNGGTACNFCHLVQLAQNLINTGIFILITLAAFMFAYAGLLHLTAQGDSSKAAKARSIFTHVAVGLVIILGAWLAVDTLMKAMVDERAGGVGPWNAIGCAQTASF